MSRSLLYAGVKERKRDTPVAPEIAFAPVVLTEPPGVAMPPAARAPVALTSDRPAIEIETKAARVRLPVDTKPATVLAVIKALRTRLSPAQLAALIEGLDWTRVHAEGIPAPGSAA